MADLPLETPQPLQVKFSNPLHYGFVVHRMGLSEELEHRWTGMIIRQMSGQCLSMLCDQTSAQSLSHLANCPAGHIVQSSHEIHEHAGSIVYGIVAA